MTDKLQSNLRDGDLRAEMLAALRHAQEALAWYGAEKFEENGKLVGDVVRDAIAKATS